MAHETDVRSPEAVQALFKFAQGIDRRSQHLGRRYFEEQRVEDCSDDGTTVQATVHGSQAYTTQLRFIRGRWSSGCSCPVGVSCKHTYALALHWLAHGPASPDAALAPLTAATPSFRDDATALIEPRLGRPLTAQEKAFLGRLKHLWSVLRSRGYISASDVETLGLIPPEAQRHPHGALYQGWWSGPLKDPIELWQYLAYDLEKGGQTVPPFLRPISDSAEIKRRLTQQERSQAIQRWTDRLEQLLRATPAKVTVPAAPAELALEQVRLRLGFESWDFQIRRHAEDKWRPGTIWLEALVKHPENLTVYAGDPPTFAFLALCQAHQRLHHYGTPFRSRSEVRELVHSLVMHPLARQLVTGPSGEPVRLAAEPLRWQLTTAPDQPDDVQLGLHRVDGTPLPAAAVHLPGHPSLYWHDHDIYQGPPPLDGQSAAAALVPIEVIEKPSILRRLLHIGAELPARVRERFQRVSLQPRVELAGTMDYLGQERLELRLLAVSDQPKCTWQWSNNGWVEDEDAPHTNSSGLTYLYDAADADALTPGLGRLRLNWDVARKCWTRRLTRDGLEDLLAWHDALPPGVQVAADTELQEIFRPSIRATIDFDLLESASHRDWFDLSLALRTEDSTLTPQELNLLLKAKGRLVQLPKKGWRRLHVEIDDSTTEALERLGFDRGALAEAALGGERHRFHALQLAQPDLSASLSAEQRARLQARASELTSVAPPAVPDSVRATLRPYQVEGYHFLSFLAHNGLGGILADDMGLGKTVQTLTWLVQLARQQPAEKPLRVLVVCPKSVVGNWEAEAARFTPELQVRRFTGSDAVFAREPTEPTVVVANYTQLRLRAEQFQGVRWHAVVLDEGQFIKNPTAKVAQVARSLESAHRLVLTGTPVENRLLDLWSLFAFALPGLLGPQANFKRLYPPHDPLALTRLRARVRHFLLRRTKSQVAADLPPRTEEDLLVDLEGSQATLYQAELKRARAQLLGVKTAQQFDQARFNILASLLRLRQICCHPALVGGPANSTSAKMEALVEHVTELREEGHQVLVFSQFVSMLELIAQRLDQESVPYLLLTGQTENREELVQRFQSERDRTVFLLSLKAAGFGLNLTAASYVILYDPWWNPAVEAQAIDRTHRIGQTAPVMAYRLIARGTIEEKIRSLQREKAALASAIVQEESLTNLLDLDSLRQILS
jgi:superfamily II DNA or RNA helicase